MKAAHLALIIGFIAFVAGCLTEDTVNCGEVGCPVGAIEPAKNASVCDNGALEDGEDCESGYPCAIGFCRHCKCLDASTAEVATDCAATCAKYGYINGSVEKDGSCNILRGVENGCVAKCSYRKIFPTAEQGNVCCCRMVVNIRCQTSGNSTCNCPTQDRMGELCSRYAPGVNASSSNMTLEQASG